MKLLMLLLTATFSQAIEIPELCKSYEGREQMFCIAITIQEKRIELLEAQNKLLRTQNESLQEIVYKAKGF